MGPSMEYVYGVSVDGGYGGRGCGVCGYEWEVVYGHAGCGCEPPA